jgi:hypothetical protein
MARAPRQARTLNLITQCIQNLTHSKTIRSLELFSHQHCTIATPQWLGSTSTHRRLTQSPHVPTHTPPTPTPTPTPTHCLQCSWAGHISGTVSSCCTPSAEYASFTCIPDTKAHTQQILTYIIRGLHLTSWPRPTNCLHPRRKTHTHSDMTP